MVSRLVTQSLEVERKYVSDDDAASAALPPLDGVGGVAVAEVVPVLLLDATYYDTADLQLVAHRVTLRRRTGGVDDGWHLKLPAPGDARKELALPLGRSTLVPGQLRGLVRGFTAGAALVPVVALRTERARVLLRGSDGSQLAEVSDDRVHASAPDGTELASWREVEVELGSGGPDLLDGVEERLVAAGLHRSPAPSKLARALGERVRPAASLVAAPELTAESPASDVVMAHVRDQVAELGRWDPEVRRDTSDAVHKMRVAARRLRSALATYRPFLDRTVTDPLRDELRWLGEELGHARDTEVMRDRLLAAIAAQPRELVIGPVVRRVRRELGGGYQDARRAAVAELDGERYARLRARLEALCASPPLTELAAQPAPDVLPRAAHRAWTRVRDHARAVEEAPGPQARDTALHEVRKAAKRARYAGESMAPALGEPATEFATAMEGLQEVLGDHQDGVVTRSVLREMGVRAHLDGENAFTYGLLAGLEEARAERAEEAYGAALASASRGRLRRWMR